MGIHNKISPGYAYYLTITVVEWIDIFSRPVYKHLIVDSINYCIANKGLKVYCWCLMRTLYLTGLGDLSGIKFWYAGKNDRKIKYYKVWQEGNDAQEIHSTAFLEEKPR